MLLEAGCPSNSHCASRAIGYRQALAFLEEAQRAGAAAVAAAAAAQTADGPTPQAVVSRAHSKPLPCTTNAPDAACPTLPATAALLPRSLLRSDPAGEGRPGSLPPPVPQADDLVPGRRDVQVGACNCCTGCWCAS